MLENYPNHCDAEYPTLAFAETVATQSVGNLHRSTALGLQFLYQLPLQ